jgi:hypothetical protein
MHEPRARIEAEAEEPDLPRRRLEGHRVVVRHGDVEGAPSMCFDRVAPPTARLCSGLR